MDIDEYDPYSVPFGIIDHHTGAPVAVMRIVTTKPQPSYALSIRHLAARSGEPGLQARLLLKPTQPFPSLAAYDSTTCDVSAELARYTEDHCCVAEYSRFITQPDYRHCGLMRPLAEFGLAFALWRGMTIGLAACSPRMLPLYAKYGFQRLTDIGLSFNEKVREMSFPIVNDMRNIEALPEPASTHISGMVEQFKCGTQGYLLYPRSAVRSVEEIREGTTVRAAVASIACAA